MLANKSKPKVKTFSINFPKLHSLGHYAAEIKEPGSSKGFSPRDVCLVSPFLHLLSVSGAYWYFRVAAGRSLSHTSQEGITLDQPMPS